MRTPARLIHLIALISLLLGSQAWSAPPALQGGDHHMHLRSQKAAEAWAALCEAMPPACAQLPSKPAASTAASLIPLLDEAGLGGGEVLSIAYFFGFPELGDGAFSDPALVRAENQYVADQVAQYPQRLVGFFSVNPLADYAVDEVRYWAGRPGLQGLKLHLANSNVDLGNEEHLDRLAELFAVLDQNSAAAVVHLRTRNPGYGYADATAFIDRVLVGAPNVVVQIAHMGGWGGYDEATDGAVQAFLDAFGDGRLKPDRIYFDLAAVPMPQTPEEQLRLLGERIRQVGPERMLFGTDWDALGTPAETMRSLQSLDIVSPETWQLIFANRAPWLH